MKPGDDIFRVWASAIAAKRYPTNAEFLEAAITLMLRDYLSSGKFKLPALRAQFGGISRERTIRKAAKAMAFHAAQIEVDDTTGTMLVPDSFREMFVALRREMGNV